MEAMCKDKVPNLISMGTLGFIISFIFYSIPAVKLLPMDHTKSYHSFLHETNLASSPSQTPEQTQEEPKHSHNRIGSPTVTDSSTTQLHVPSTLTASGGASSELPVSQMTGSMAEIMWEVLSSWCTTDTILFLTNPLPSVSNNSEDLTGQKVTVSSCPVLKKENEGHKTEGFKQKPGRSLKSKGENTDVVEQKMEMSDEEMMEKLRRFQVNVDTGRFIDDLAVCGAEDVKEGNSEKSAPVPVVEKLDSGSVVVKEHHAMDNQVGSSWFTVVSVHDVITCISGP